ncbi:MAG: hypothetical protein KGJ62_05715 [Armatimonadetes bacterium]|nr:hypothetical protein [Armatimonadota bacterium]MDE2205991.1 hypothetical protein [Armatimonadota bacterium]
MADFNDVRRIALSLPEVSGDMAFSVMRSGRSRGFAWVWLERIDPRKPRVPNPEVIAIRTPDLAEKEALLAADPDIFFTEPHYNNYPAILVRLANIPIEELEELLVEGWRCRADKALVLAFDAARADGNVRQ